MNFFSSGKLDPQISLEGPAWNEQTTKPTGIVILIDPFYLKS